MVDTSHKILVEVMGNGFNELRTQSESLSQSLQKIGKSANPISAALDLSLAKRSGFKNPLDDLVSSIQKSRPEITNLGDAFKTNINGAIKTLNPQIKQLRDNVSATNKELSLAKSNSRQLTSNMLGMGLSFLFTGMAIKRFAQGMLTDLFNTYKNIMGEGTVFQEQTNALSAAFSFLKFSIFDALANTEFFANLVDWLVQAANWLAEFTQKHPLITQIVLGFLALLVVLGGFLMIVGQATLGILGLIAAGKLFAGLNFTPLLTGFKAVVLAMQTIWHSFITASGIAAVAWALGLAAIFAFVFNNWQQKLGGWANFFKIVLAGMITIVGVVADAMITVFLAALDVILIPLRTLIALYNSVASKMKKSTISLQVGGFDLSRSLAGQYAQQSFGEGGGIAGNLYQKMLGTDFFGGALQNLNVAKEQYGVGGLLSPFTAPNIPEAEAVTQTVNNIQTTTNNSNEYNFTINNADNMTVDELYEEIMRRVEQNSTLNNGSPRS